MYTIIRSKKKEKWKWKVFTDYFRNLQKILHHSYSLKCHDYMLFATNLLKPDCIVAVGADLSKLSYVDTYQLKDKNLGLGDETGP